MKKLNSFLLRLLFIIAFFSFAANYGLYAAEKKIIKLWTFWEQDLFQDGIDVFLKNNPDYEIEYQQLSWASGKDKIVTAVAGGAEPDIIELGSTWMAEFMEYNSLADITGFPEKEDYVGGFESAANNGRIYGLPLFGSVNIIYYNKTLFKRANIISVPKTLNELLKCSEKIKKLGNDYFGFSIKISSKITTWQKFVPFLWTFNGKILSDDFSNVLITSPEIISSFEYYYKLSKTSYIGTQDSARQAFYMGKLGMIFDGPGLDLDQKAPGLEWDYFLIPGLTGSQLGKSFTGVDYLAVFAGSSHKIKSVELMDILAEKCKISDKIKTLLPFHKNNLDNYLKKYPQGFFYAEQLKNSMTSQPYANWESLMEVLNYGIESVVLNRSPVKEAIVKTQKEMTDIINSHKIQGGKINMRFIDFVIWGAGLLFTLWLIIKIRNRSVISFLSPWIISFILFSLYPVLHSIFVSFTNYNPLTADNVFFINFKNYLEIVKDGHFIAAFKNTLIFTGISIPVTVSIALILAVFLNENIAFKRLFRASFFFPVITSVIVIAMIFNYLYATFGPLNAMLKYFGFNEIDFLNEPKYALMSITVMSIWAGFGYYMLLFLAALQSIPEELYESSALDGASSVKNFIYITIPSIKSMILFVIVISTIRSLQVFAEMFVMTGGGPLESTTSVVYYLYNYGFSKYQMGYASAAAYILFIVIFILSVIQLKIFKTEEQ